MHGKIISELNIGDRATLKKVFTLKDVKKFAQLSCDINPIHLDESVAKESIFKQRIVHGMLTASLFSAIFGNDLPGQGTIYLGQNLNFLKPVYLNEEIIAEVFLIEKSEDKNIVVFETICTNSKGEKVIKGTATLMPPK